MALHYITASLLLMITATECSKILIIVGVSARSHYNVFVPLIEELATRNHQVTVHGYYSINKPHLKVEEIMLTQGKIEQTTEIVKEFFLYQLKIGSIKQMKNVAYFMGPLCAQYLNDTTTKKLVDSGIQYDLVIIDSFFGDCQKAVASLVGKHVMNLFTCGYFPWHATAAPTPFSYVPNSMDSVSSKMNFFERFENAVNLIALRYIYQYTTQANNQKVLSELLPQAGTLEDIEKKVVFSLTNGDPVVDTPRPTMPNIVNCGGMHCRKAKPLPKDLNEFVESSGNEGFIIFGLGSNMKSEYLSNESIQDILSVFKRLKQNVIWKFGAQLKNLPKNVKIVDWMPQQDLLGHPKARLFITHSGLLSLQEAIYHQVPIVGMPFFGDQRGNIRKMKDLGIGEHIDFLNLTADSFYEVITKVLNDKRYYENMKKYSAIFKDQPERPIDRAVFWIEYVIRHDGARHFRSAGEDLKTSNTFF